MKKKNSRRKPGRPKGSKANPKSREDALFQILKWDFMSTKDSLLREQGVDLQKTIDFDFKFDWKEEHQRLFNLGFVHGIGFVEQQVFPRYIKKHLKNIRFQPYVNRAVYIESIADHRYKKMWVPGFFPSLPVRKARMKLTPITKEERKKVINEKNQMKTLDEIAGSTGVPIERVNIIVEKARKAGRVGALLLRNGKQLLDIRRRK